MNQQPDKLFRDKLAHYQRTPPAPAWNKIEAGLQKNTTNPAPVLGWKVAASVSILAVAAYLLWPTAETNVPLSTIAAAKQEAPLPTENQQQPPPKNETVISPEEKRIQSVDERSAKPSKEKTTTNNITTGAVEGISEQSIAKVEEPDMQHLTPSVSTIESENRNTTVPLPAEEVLATANDASFDTKPVRLVFTVTDTEEYLDKKALAQATDEEKDASTFKKLLKKAKDLKNNQDPFGDLREKKNEILALNFRNEKRGQNK